MKFDESGFRADLLAGNWSEWLIDEVVRRLEPYLTPDEDAIVITKAQAERVLDRDRAASKHYGYGYNEKPGDKELLDYLKQATS